jgi:(E)-4-hydroxy-3-methylbut-2-enyl-diphosphate synthase
VESALNNIKILEDNDFFNFKVSVKASDIFLTMKAYEKLASICDYSLHLGITEAGGRRSGSIKSSIGLGQLLLKGIGDTIRVSLSDEPEEEVKVGYEILKSLTLCLRCQNYFLPIMCTTTQPIIETVIGVVMSSKDFSNFFTVSITGNC